MSFKSRISTFLFHTPFIPYYPKNMLIQERMFKIALQELGFWNLNSVKADHKNCANYFQNRKFKLIFPKYIVNNVFGLSKEKRYQYNFIGKMNGKRNWVKNYENNKGSLIVETLKGRNKKHSFSAPFDKEYFEIISRSKFTLCPVGDFDWTYRFFESILAGSIPVVEKIDSTMQGFKFYLKTDEHMFKNEYINFNLGKFLLENTFINRSHFNSYEFYQKNN
jgi:hypothetical protein